METALEPNSSLRKVYLNTPSGFSSAASASCNTDDYSGVPDEYSVDANVYHNEYFSVGWRVMSKGYAIELSNLELAAARAPGNGPRILLSVPSVISSKCVALVSTSKELIIDLVLVSGYLYTIIIPHNWMTEEIISEADMRRAIQDLTFITDLTAFGITGPRILISASQQKLLLSSSDGKLTRFDRSTPRDQLRARTLHNDFAKPEASGFSRFFKSSSDKVPGHCGLSVNAISSLIVVGENVVSYTVNNTLQTWSLSSNSCTQSLPSATSSSVWRLRPTTYLAHRDSLVAVLGLDSIKLYDIRNDQLVVRSFLNFEIPENLKSWFVLGLSILEDQSILVAFKLDMCAKIYTVSPIGVWTAVREYDNSHLMDLPIDRSFQEIKQRVLETTPAVLKLSLAQLEALFPSLDPNSTIQSLVFSVESKLEDLGDLSESHDQSHWLKLDTLCREYEAKGREFLALSPVFSTKRATFVWGVCASGFRICCIDKTETNEASEANVAVDITDELLSNITIPALTKASEKMLSSGLLMDRIEDVCTLLRRYINQKKLSDVGRVYSKRIGPALAEYFEAYGPLSDFHQDPTAHTALSKLGIDAVNMLVFDYVTKHATKLRKLLALAVIAFVEGWIADQNESDLLRLGVEILRRFSFIERVGFKNLNLEVSDVCLEDFSKDMTRSLIFKCNPSKIITELLPSLTGEDGTESEPPLVSPSAIALVERALDICLNTPETTLMRGMAHLACDRQEDGTKLIQHVSLSLPWPATATRSPKSQSEWFYRVAQYALHVRAEKAAFKFAQLGESLAEGPAGNDMRALLFQLAIKEGNIAVAYLALTRRFMTFRDTDEEKVLASKWIRELIIAAAQLGGEDARLLVVSYPFIGFAQSLQEALVKSVSFSSVPSYKLRYAWFVERDDFVGAAQVIYQHIRQDTSLDLPRQSELYTVCLNALALAPKASRWLHDGYEVVHFDDIKLQQDEVLARIAQQL